MKKMLLLSAAGFFLLSGCSRDYTPTTGESGADTFKNACMECHEAVEGHENTYYEIASEKQNLKFFTKKISSGSLIMPKFPNITGEHLKATGQYALDHSITK